MGKKLGKISLMFCFLINFAKARHAIFGFWVMYKIYGEGRRLSELSWYGL